MNGLGRSTVSGFGQRFSVQGMVLFNLSEVLGISVLCLFTFDGEREDRTNGTPRKKIFRELRSGEYRKSRLVDRLL